LRGRNHSVVKTIRLPVELNQYLNEESKRNNQTTAAFIASILLNYQNRYQLVDKLNPVAMRQVSMALFVSSVDEKRLEEIGVTLSSDVLPMMSIMFAPGTNADWLEWCVTEFLPSVNWYSCLISRRGCLISHDMGKKWTIFLHSFLRNLINKYQGEKPVLEIDGDNIFLKPRKNHIFVEE
jgi:hypothetical protein